ncbi:MAG: HSP90 family protein [Actinomycetales bacterium]|nr:HSP90 family protein [Candidatus Phosphoribacter baldrii]MBK6954738.1 HSP90 family protein [Candidatus Phosphoribacter baldrii]
MDLRGMVDLLSHHLYSSPRVYLRELVQNSADAITARAAVEPDCPRRIEIVPADVADDGFLHIHDTGIGLDAESIRSVLATIGASTKRDELGFARGSFLGQFGIGLLSCFLVCDEIVLHTRRVGAEQTWTWSGAADGTYTVTPAQTPRADPGTEVVLRPRGIEPLLGWSQVGALAELFAAYLPVELIVHTPDGPRDVGGRTFPWEDPTLTGGRRREAAERLSDDLLGIRPLDVIELADPVTGVHGFAFVTPAPAGRRAHHRLYAKRMLVGEAVEAILPDWAFFVRAVLDGDRLELTASRESLQDNEALAETRERLGAAIRRWLLRTAATDPDRMRRFLQVHHLGAKAMAAEDDEMLDIVAGLLPWETTRGQMSLADFAALDPVLRYAESIEDFRQIAPLASVGGVAVLNAGYAYDGELIRRWLARHPGSDARRIAPSELSTGFEPVDPAERARFARLLATAQEALDRTGVVADVRRFAPEDLQAVLLIDRDGRRERDRAEVREDLDGPWAALLDATARPQAKASFVVNAANLTVRRLAEHPDATLQRHVIEALYAHALIAGQHPLRPVDSALVSRALPNLIDRALDGRPT